MELINTLRPDIDEYFIRICNTVKLRSTCLRHKIGAVTVLDKRILTTGYNGAPSGLTDCTELGCLRNELKIESGTKQEICRAVHAEQNAIIQASIHGISLLDSTMYCTFSPCVICAKMIINAGIDKVIYIEDYSDGQFKELFDKAGIEYRRYKL